MSADPVLLRRLAFQAVLEVPTAFEGVGVGLLERTRAALGQAAAYLDALLAQIPDGGDAIPDAAFADPTVDRRPFSRAALVGWRAQLDVLIAEAEAAREAAGPRVGPGALALPEGALRLEAAPELPTETPFPATAALPLLRQGWTAIDDAMPEHPGMALLRHTSGATLWLAGDVDAVRAWRVHQGARALRDWATYGLVLPDDTRRALHATLRGADEAGPALEAWVARTPALSVTAWVALAGGSQRRLGLWLVETLQPVRRLAVLATLDGEDGRLLGHHLLEGDDAFDQLARASVQVAARSSDPVVAALGRVVDLQARLEADLGAFLVPGADLAALTATLRPAPGDAARAFTDDVAPAVEQAAAALWDTGPLLRPSPGQSEVRAHVASAGALAAGLEPLARSFPDAWRATATFLDPHRVWASVVFHRPGERSGMRYDGLVWLDDRWVWFPKPWRLLPPEAVARLTDPAREGSDDGAR